MAEAQKKVFIRLFGADSVSGYLPAGGFLDGDAVALMHADGKLISYAISAIKMIAYVRDFILDDPLNPEQLGRRNFLARPRNEGLWLRVTFRDGGVLEGLAPLDISFLDPLITDRGVMMTPPDPRSNAYRIFVPRAAMANFELLGLVTSAAKRKAAAKPVREPQPWLFED